MRITIIQLFFVLLILSCSKKENTKQIEHVMKTNIKDSSTLRKLNLILLDSAVSLNLVKNLAESYNPPNSSSKGFGKLPELNDSIKTAFEVLKRKNYQKFQKYLSLIFIKLLRSHLMTSNQSYELRNHDGEGDSLKKEREFLVYEFNSMAKIYPFGKRIEMFTSSVAQVWLERNPELLMDKDIKREMIIIKSIEDDIEREYAEAVLNYEK